MDTLSELGELVTLLAKAMVDEPDAVEVFEVAGVRTTILELTVARNDLGKIIGKRGRNAEALRIILSAAAMKFRKRTHLEIVEPES